MANSATSKTTGQPAKKPGAGLDPASQPGSLSDLITYVMERDGYRKLMPMANHGRIPYKTLYAWWTAERGLKHGPSEDSLKIFAEDFDLPLPLVLHAAGRATDPLEFGEEDLQVLHLYKELDPEDRDLAEGMLRNLAERARSKKITRS